MDAVADGLHVRGVERIVDERSAAAQLAAGRVALARLERQRLVLHSVRADGVAQYVRRTHGRGDRANRLVETVEKERAAGVFRTVIVPLDDRVLGQHAGGAAVQRRIAHLDPVERIGGGIQPRAAQSARVPPSLHEPVAHNRLLEPNPLVVRADGCSNGISRGGHRCVDRDVGARILIPVKEKVATGRDGARQRGRLGEPNLRIVPASARPGHGDRVRERPGHRETDVARAGSPRRGDRDRTRTKCPGCRDLHAARLDRHAARERVGAAQDKRPRARLADRAAARDRLRDGLRSARRHVDVVHVVYLQRARASHEQRRTNERNSLHSLFLD